jgi:hypothetical protein
MHAIKNLQKQEIQEIATIENQPLLLQHSQELEEHQCFTLQQINQF